MIQRSEPRREPAQLAALECGASCVVTALHLLGLDDSAFLRGYWQTVYFDGMLMSVRSLKWIDLTFDYGIRTTIASGSLETLDGILERGGMAIALCKASMLRFFPPSLLGFESAGFYHCLLLRGKSRESGNYLAIDPVAGFSGEIGAKELLAASVREGEVVYGSFAMQDDFVRPSPESSLRHATGRNFSVFLKEGTTAFGKFRTEVLASSEWEDTRRREWAGRNNLTLSALARMRALVWRCFEESGLLEEEEIRVGAGLAGEVVGGWTNVNLRLVKYGVKAPTAELTNSIVQSLDRTRQAEYKLLVYLAERGRMRE